MFTYTNNHLHIKVTQGILTVKDTNNKTLILEEKSLAKFEQFYNNWNMAFNHATDTTFAANWCFNETFNFFLRKALEAIEFVGYEDLKLSQLEALLIHTGEDEGEPSEGLIFRLHNTYPKLIALQ